MSKWEAPEALPDPGRKISLTLYSVGLPDGANGVCCQIKDDQYMILINSDNDPDKQAEAFLHEMLHIWNRDFDRISSPKDVQRIETQTHEQIKKILPVLPSSIEA